MFPAPRFCSFRHPTKSQWENEFGIALAAFHPREPIPPARTPVSSSDFTAPSKTRQSVWHNFPLMGRGAGAKVGFPHVVGFGVRYPDELVGAESDVGCGRL